MPTVPGVLAYEPPTLFVFSWDITTRSELEPNPDKASEVAVTFVAERPDRTRVALVHRHLGRHGEGWEGMRDAVGQGWAGRRPSIKKPCEVSTDRRRG